MLKAHNHSIAVALAIVLSSSMVHGQVAPKAPEPATLKANADFARTLPFANRDDFEDAMRGFIATIPDATIAGSGPRPVWTMKPYDFLKQNEAADSVNPSLWRQAQLNAIHGLFKVTDRVYQVRGFDHVQHDDHRGRHGADHHRSLSTAETARAALALY